MDPHRPPSQLQRRDPDLRAELELDADDQTAFKRHMSSAFGVRLSNCPSRLQICEHYRFEDSRLAKGKGSKTWNLRVKGTTGQQRTPRPFDARTDEWKGAADYLKGALPKIWYFPNFLFELPDKFLLNQVVGAQPAEDMDKAHGDGTYDQLYFASASHLHVSLNRGLANPLALIPDDAVLPPGQVPPGMLRHPRAQDGCRSPAQLKGGPLARRRPRGRLPGSDGSGAVGIKSLRRLGALCAEDRAPG